MTKPARARPALLFAFASSALAHAILVAVSPAVNTTVAGPDVRIELRFNSRIDAARSRLTVVLPDQTMRPVAIGPQSSPAALSSRVAGLGAGAYKLRWQVLAVDGHITRGEVPFQVK
jgi:copper resistance protein C